MANRKESSREGSQENAIDEIRGGSDTEINIGGEIRFYTAIIAVSSWYYEGWWFPTIGIQWQLIVI